MTTAATHAGPASLVEKAIDELLREYVRCPLLYLRERNLQARLGQLIAAEMQDAGLPLRTEAALWSARDVRDSEHVGQVHRVQHEVKVKEAEGLATDTVVLRLASPEAPIRLTREVKGHLDVVACVPASDIEVFVELKAACSADEDQRGRFRKDVAKLWALAGGPTGQARTFHFVLIDKSITIAPFQHADAEPDSAWELGKPYGTYTRQRSGEERFAPVPQLRLSPSEASAAVDGPVVHVWDLANLGLGVCPRHRVCVGLSHPSEDEARLQGLVIPKRRRPR